MATTLPHSPRTPPGRPEISFARNRMALQRDPRVAALLPEAQATINRVARSFALAARFLPRDVRDSINLLYLALRRLDDLVDLEAPRGSAQRADAQQRLVAIRTWINTGAIDQAGGDELAIFVNLQRSTPSLPIDAIDGRLRLWKKCRHARIALGGHAVTGERDFRSARWRAR